jgi:ABC-type branched-subunit amino acid transport system substrate-binding protein
MAKQEFNVASALTGFAIGAVVTLLATIAILPSGSGGRGGGRTLLGTGGGAGGGGYAAGAAADLDLDSIELAEGEQLAIDDTTGEVVVVDASGEVVRTVDPGPAAPSGGGAGGGGDEVAVGDGGGSTGGRTGSGVQVGGGGSGGGGSSGGGGGGGGAGGSCAAGANGGATDTGVTATEIKLGATVAESGIAQSFLGQVRQAMEAMKNKVNRAGGICGRQLRIVYKDDGWDPQRGAGFIQNLVEGEKVFALAVSPSSEGLNQASAQGYFAKQGVPVVGADGLNVTQFKDPMIWPVAAATVTTIDVMMKNAYDRGARHPAIVFGNTYRFGVEGAYAANAAWQKLTNSDIPGYKNPLAAGGGSCENRFCGVSAGQGQYGNQVSTLNTACNSGDRCDFLVLLLEPKTAQDWMAVPGVKQPKDFAKGMGGPQPLFTFGFGRACGDRCAGMWVWTGYNPPIEQYRNQPAVSAYMSDLKGQSASADEFNQFTMGGYVGMQLLVEALKQTGPNLTRGALVQKLNSMAPLNTGLTTAALQWTAGSRYANHSAQAFEMQARNGFTGWRFVQPPIRDPWLGQHSG